MFRNLDLLGLFICAAVWLGPMLANLRRGRLWLMHPSGFFPLMVIYMLLPPLFYRWGEEGSMLQTASMWGHNPWFLAEPMLVLALAGAFYHLGVKLGGTPLTLGPQDSPEAYLPLPSRKGIGKFSFAVVVFAVFALSQLMFYLKPVSDYGKGYYWITLFYKSYIVLPLLAFQQDRSLGLLFLLLSIPGSLFMKSKAIFLYSVIGFFLLYQTKLFRLSKSVAAVLIGLILLTPLAVSLYGTDIYRSKDLREFRNAEELSWGESIQRFGEREYAFETFACIYQKCQEGGEEVQWGRKNYEDFLKIIPTYFWPAKPLEFFDFPAEYLPLDYFAYEMYYAHYFLTAFYQDFRLLGVALAGLILGLIFGFGYWTSLRLSRRRQELWPLMIYLCLVVNSKYFVESTFWNALVECTGSVLAILLVILLSFPLAYLDSRWKECQQPAMQPQRIATANRRRPKR
jgi:hypothetical protein